MLTNLPPDRIISPNLPKEERQSRFLEALYDRDVDTVKNEYEVYSLRVRRKEIKQKLKVEENKELRRELEEINVKLGEP
jgi:hypothetical protein